MTWQAGALHDYEFGDLSIADIGKKYGREPNTITKLIGRSGLSKAGPKSKGGRIPYDQQEVISPIHKQIGIRMNIHRTVTLDELPSEYAVRVNTSPYALRQMELGLHDFSLSQLDRISRLLDTNVCDLINPKAKEIYAR